jgi:hypothetical protein
MKHIHAELMALYAQDAMETDKPWERWQIQTNHSGAQWHDIKCNCTWNPSCNYRRKPRTININGHDVPEPVREQLKEGRRYYSPCIASGMGRVDIWTNHNMDNRLLELGIIHLTREAAEAHAKALLSFTEKQP